MATINLQNLSGQFVNLAAALNVGLVPQGNGSWIIPSATPAVNQGMLCGGPVLLATPTYAPRGILVQRPMSVTQIDAIADAFQDNLNEGVLIAADTKISKRALDVVNGWYGRARGIDEEAKSDAPSDPLSDPDDLRKRAEMALFDCLKGVAICVVLRQQKYFNPTMITEGLALATELQRFLLNPMSPAMALLAELDAEAVSMQPPNKGSGEDLAAEQRRSAMQKVGIAWRSFADYLMMNPEADGAPEGLLEAAIYRGAYYLYAGQSYNGLGALYEAASTHYGSKGDRARTGQYALRAAWAYSNRPEEAKPIILRGIDHVFFEHLMPNLAQTYRGTEAHPLSRAQKIAEGLSRTLRLPRDGGDGPRDCKPVK